jgi:hypothetical protein
MSALFCACTTNSNGKNDDLPFGPSFLARSYIHGFMGREKLRAGVVIGNFKVDEDSWTIDYYGGKDPDENVCSLSDGISLGVRIEGSDGFNDCARLYSYHDDDCIASSQKYLAQVEAIGDTLFNKTIYGTTHLAISTLAKIKSVIISSDKDYNIDYPAGSNLNAFFTIYFNDPYALIKNNYHPIAGTYKYKEDSFHNPNYPFAVFKEKLSDVNFPERPFIDCRWDIVLDVAPQHTDAYTFYIRVILEDDTVMETSTAIPLNIKGTDDAV